MEGPGMSSFSDSVSLQKGNEDPRLRDRLEPRKEPTSTRTVYRPNTGPKLHIARSGETLVVKKLPPSESILPAALALQTPRSELQITTPVHLARDQKTSSDEESETFEDTIEQPVQGDITKGTTGTSSARFQEISGRARIISDERLWPEDEKRRMAILIARFKNLEMDKAEEFKQLVSAGSQLQESWPETGGTIVGLGQNIPSTENQNAKEISELRKRLEKAESEKAEFRRNFEDAQEQIFSMQPRRSEITEGEAVKEYGSLYASVEHWIDKNFIDVINLDHMIFAHSNVNIGSGSRLLSLIEITPGAINAKNVPDTLHYYVRSAIMNFICREIFSKDIYTANAGRYKLLQTIEVSMRSLEPRRDRATIRAWRSEMLTALLATPDYKNARRQRAKELAGRLCAALEGLLPHATKARLVALKSSISQDLILPALKLGERFHLSAKIFSQPGRGMDNHILPIGQDIGMYEYRNHMETGKLVKTVPHDAHRKYLLDICPGLYCSNLKVDSVSAPKQLKKAQILVAILRPEEHYMLHADTALGHIFAAIEIQRTEKSKETLNSQKRSVTFSGSKLTELWKLILAFADTK